MPVIDFDLLRQYSELVGNDLANLGPLVQFDQQIRARLDERGFVLRSFSIIVAGSLGQHLVVNGPFLLMVRYKDSPKPYFAAWIANDKLLVPYGK